MYTAYQGPIFRGGHVPPTFGQGDIIAFVVPPNIL